ncbi:MAG: hypothetical protein ACO22Z_04535, partial [Paracoccaceae bacterium]
IERRGSGRSWSVVEYIPDLGPYSGKTSSTKLNASQRYGNTELASEVRFFTSGQVGALFQITHSGQSGVFKIGYVNAATPAIEVTGIGDTGTASAKIKTGMRLRVDGNTGTVTILD